MSQTLVVPQCYNSHGSALSWGEGSGEAYICNALPFVPMMLWSVILFPGAMSDEDDDHQATPATAEPTAAGELSASQIMFANILARQLAAIIVSGLQGVAPAPLLPCHTPVRFCALPILHCHCQEMGHTGPSSNAGPTATSGTAVGPLFAGCGTSIP